MCYTSQRGLYELFSFNDGFYYLGQYILLLEIKNSIFLSKIGLHESIKMVQG